MNDFVGQCLREWKRLGVPDPVADEMAAELAADLEEAAAEGVSAPEVLGGPLDPRAFAAAWAAERGVVRSRPSRRPLLRGVTAALSIAAVAAAVAILVTPTGTTTSAFPSPASRVGQSVQQVWVVDTGSPSHGTALVLTPPNLPRASGNDGADTAAWALLAAGLAGLALAAGARVRVGRHAPLLRA